LTVLVDKKGAITMMHNPFSVTSAELMKSLGSSAWPQVIDVRDDTDYPADPRDIPGSIHRREADFAIWVSTLDCNRPVVVSCQKGYKISQGIVARLRAMGWRAASLKGGYLGWVAAGLPLLQRQSLLDVGLSEKALMVTRLRPKIDRIACPWLISRFVAPAAEFIYVEADQVKAVADRTGGVAYDIKDCTITHVGDDCSFDTILKFAGLDKFEPLAKVAQIVRGADNARFDLAPEAAGLLAISLGLSHLSSEDDHDMLKAGFSVYDGLYAWAAHASAETHNWPPKA
jgi:rhodanese-related sulfurtransferase